VVGAAIVVVARLFLPGDGGNPPLEAMLRGLPAPRSARGGRRWSGDAGHDCRNQSPGGPRRCPGRAAAWHGWLLLAGGFLVGLIALIADGLGSDSQDVLFSGQASIPALISEASCAIRRGLVTP
jgi:hypothetical protein